MGPCHYSLAELPGAASVNPPALGWGREGVTPGLDPMGGGEEGAGSLSSFYLGSRDAAVNQQPQGNRFPWGAGSRTPASWCCGLPSRGSPAAPTPPASGAAVHGGREDSCPTAGAGWGLAAAVIQRGRGQACGSGGRDGEPESREPPLGARTRPWLLLMDWDGLSRLGRSLGLGEVRAEPQEKGGELPPEALWLWQGFLLLGLARLKA